MQNSCIYIYVVLVAQELQGVGFKEVMKPSYLQSQWFGVNHKTIETVVTFIWSGGGDYEKTKKFLYPKIPSVRRRVSRSNDVLPPVPSNSNEIVNDKNALCLLTQSSYYFDSTLSLHVQVHQNNSIFTSNLIKWSCSSFRIFKIEDSTCWVTIKTIDIK